jgi:hypothetical protein
MKIFFIVILILLQYLKSYSQNSGPDSGNSLLFNSATIQRININNSGSFNHLSNNISIEIWIFPTSSSLGCIISKHETNSTREYDLFHLANGTLRFGLFDNLDGIHLTTSNTAIPLNQWTHVAATYSGATGIANIYINGILDVTNNIGVITIASTSVNLLIGAYWLINNITSRNHFDGYIDEVRLWHEVRSQIQIRTNMCKSLVLPQMNLIAYYKFDEPSGIIANDASGSNNNGFLENFSIAQTNAWNFSGAPIGNESTYLYPASWTGLNLILASTLFGTDEGSLNINNVNGNPIGVHLYRVDAIPSQITGLTNPATTYFGTFIAGGTGITYSALYNYTGSIYGNSNPCEPNYRIAERDDNSDGTWISLNSILNTTANTLSATGIDTRKEIILNKTCISLPLDFVSFNIYENSDHTIKLDWTTINQKNTIKFIIEKASNYNIFKPIGEIDVTNMYSNTNLYSYIDQESLNYMFYYYRIKEIDIDGRYSYSSIKSIKVENENLYDIFPNPSNGNITIKTNTDCLIFIKDIRGENIYDHSNTAIHNANLYNLTPGIYFITFINKKTVITKKIIITQ